MNPVKYGDACHRKSPKASGPCRIRGRVSCGCGKVNCLDGRDSGFVYDHCHRHGYVRGIICTSCNNVMRYVDKIMDAGKPERLIKVQTWAPASSYIRHWEVCPECSAEFTRDDLLRVIDFAQRWVLTIVRNGTIRLPATQGTFRRMGYKARWRMNRYLFKVRRARNRRKAHSA